MVPSVTTVLQRFKTDWVAPLLPISPRASHLSIASCHPETTHMRTWRPSCRAQPRCTWTINVTTAPARGLIGARHGPPPSDAPSALGPSSGAHCGGGAVARGPTVAVAPDGPQTAERPQAGGGPSSGAAPAPLPGLRRRALRPCLASARGGAPERPVPHRWPPGCAAHRRSAAGPRPPAARAAPAAARRVPLSAGCCPTASLPGCVGAPLPAPGRLGHRPLALGVARRRQPLRGRHLRRGRLSPAGIGHRRGAPHAGGAGRALLGPAGGRLDTRKQCPRRIGAAIDVWEASAPGAALQHGAPHRCREAICGLRRGSLV